MSEGFISVSKQLTAAFWLPARDERLAALMRTAGVQDVQSDGRAVFGRWAGMYCEGRLERHGECDLLMLGYSQPSFLAIVGDDQGDRPIEADPSLALANAFRESCQSLRPVVAFMTSHLSQEEAYIVRQEPLVAGRLGEELIAKRFALLYLSDEVARDIEPPERRDTFPCPSGLMIFASTGWGRWF